MFTTFTITFISESYEKYGKIIRKNRDRKSCEILHIMFDVKKKKIEKIEKKKKEEVGSLLNPTL